MFRAGSLIGERALALATCIVSVAALTSCGGSTGNSDRQRRQQDLPQRRGFRRRRRRAAVPVARHRRQHRQPQRQHDGLDDAREPRHPLRLRDDQRRPGRLRRAAVRRQRRPARPAAAGAHADHPRRAGGHRRRRRDRPPALRPRPTTPGSSRPPPAPREARTVYLPDVQVQLFEQSTGALVFGGTTDLSGELDLPKLVAGTAYNVRCTCADGAPLLRLPHLHRRAPRPRVRTVAPVLTGAREPAPVRPRGAGGRRASAATRTPSSASAAPRPCSCAGRRRGARRAGARQPLRRLRDRRRGAGSRRARARGAVRRLRRDPRRAGFARSGGLRRQRADRALARHRERPPAAREDGRQRRRRQRPRPDGRPGDGAGSGVHPGADHYLTFKGVDTRLSACLYYRALGAVRGLRRAGQPERRDLVLRLEDARTASASAHDVAADYINQRDLNLVRRMVATRSASGGIAFYVCNAPGPRRQVADRDRRRDREAALTTRTARRLRGHGVHADDRRERRPAVHQVLHLRPRRDAAALDQSRRPRREVHARHLRRLPWRHDLQRPLPRAGDGLALPRRALPAVRHRQLPVLVASRRCPRRRRARPSSSSTSWCSATEIDPNSATSRLINGWYANGHVLDKEYVPPIWQAGRCAAGHGRRGPVLQRSGRHLVPHLPRRARHAASTGTTSSSPRRAPRSSSAAAPRTSPSMQRCRTR